MKKLLLLSPQGRLLSARYFGEKFVFLMNISIVLLLDMANIMIKSAVPGPGTYEPATNLSSIGKYPISTLP